MAGLQAAYPGRFPSEIFTEIRRLPAGMLDEILEAGAYQHAKAQTDAADTEEARKRLPQTSLFELVREIEMELAAEALAKKKAGNG